MDLQLKELSSEISFSSYADKAIRIQYEGHSYVVYIDETPISCGICYIAGISGIMQLITNHISSATCSRYEIFSHIMNTIISLVKERRSFAFYLMSTYVASKGSEYIRWLDENCSLSTDVVINPNSGNDIKLWVFTE